MEDHAMEDRAVPVAAPGRKAAKVGHRKSRHGCLKCKSRRVKCDELRPVCTNCRRLNLECSWPSPDTHHLPRDPKTSCPASASASSIKREGSPHHMTRSALHSPSRHVSPGGLSRASTDVDVAHSGHGGYNGHHDDAHRYDSPVMGEDAQRFTAMLKLWSGNTELDSLDSSPVGTSLLNPSADMEDDCMLPESKQRRMLEHRLLQNYIFNLGIPYPKTPSQGWNNLWTKIIPPMALQFDNILYAVLSHSATHLLRKEPGNRDLFHARQAYLVAAMRVQRRMVEDLNLATADAVCLASLVMLVQAFAMLDERIIDQYTPPMDWLRLGAGSGSVVWSSIQAIKQQAMEDQSVMMTIANTEPRMGDDESYFNARNRELPQLQGILDPGLASGDDWSDPETRVAYEKTLSYVGSIQIAVNTAEAIHIVCRRIQGFTMVIPAPFITFVAQRRPRALVILAHFFAAVHQLAGRGVWWLDTEEGKDTVARREVRGIRTALPPEWMVHMSWPLEVVGLGKAEPVW